jgi:hypothetical protein
MYGSKPVCHYCKKGPTNEADLYLIDTVGTYYQHVPPCEANKEKIMPDGKEYIGQTSWTVHPGAANHSIGMRK